MIFNTDILIWAQRGSEKAADIIDASSRRYISVQTYMELFQSALNKKQHQVIRSMLTEFNFIVLPFTENISHRASIYVEHYALSNGVRAGDAIIAATAVEANLVLCTANQKHFKPIPELQLKVIKIQWD